MQGNEPEVILAIFPLLASAALSAVGAGIGAYGKYKAAKANKPIKERAFKQRANTGYLKRYMADLRGRSADRARTELAMRPALRAIGAQQQQGQRQLAYQAAQQGLEGSGIEAQKQLTLQQGTTQAVAGLGEKVLSQQLAQARQMQAQKEGQRMKLAGEIGRQEGAVSEANRLAEFQANETNRQRQQQYDQSVSAARSNIGTSMLGGAVSGATPGLTSMAGGTPQVDTAMDILQTTGGSPSTTASIAPPTSADLTANMMELTNQSLGIGTGNTSNLAYTPSYLRQPQSNYAYANYENGGLVGATREDVYSIAPGIKKRYQELEKTYQTEYDTAMAEHEKQLKIEEENRIKSEADLAAKNKKIEEANLLAEQKHVEQKKLFETGEGRRDVLEAQKYTTELLKEKGVEKGGETIYGTKGLTGENVEGALEYIKTDPEEYNVLKEKADVLKQYSIGEKQLTKAKTQYEKVKDNFESFEDYLSQVTSDPNADVERLFGKNLSKKEKKKLSNKYNKKTLALLQSKGGFGAVDESFDPESLQGEMTPDEYAQLVKDRQLAYKFDEALETKDPGEFKPQELAKEEYKPQYAAEAPTLQEISQKEVEKIEREELTKLHKAGVDLSANIATAKTQREEMEFAKLLTDPNVDPNQLWQTTHAQNNPIETAKMINKMRTADVQFASEQIETNVISGVNTALETGDPSAIMDQVSSSDPEYAELLKTNPQKAFSMRKSARIEADKIASSNASDTNLATQMNDAKRGIDTILWAVGDEGTSKAIMEVLDEAGNEQSITDAHLETIKDLLDNMSPSAGGEERLQAQLESKEIDQAQFEIRLDILKHLGKDNSGIKKQILSKLNKEKFIRPGKVVPPEVKPPPWNDNPTISGN